MTNEINLIIADDHPIFRAGLRQIIEKEDDFRIVGESTDGEESLKLIKELKPAVAILDIDMPKMSGLQVLYSLKRDDFSIRVIFLTVHRSWESFYEAWQLGAKGYVLKDSAVEDIVKAIHAVMNGESYTSPVLTEHFQKETNGTKNQNTFKLQQLTATERQILRLIGEYQTNKQIAESLFISPLTVKTHRRNIISKFGLEGNNQLIKIALEYKENL